MEIFPYMTIIVFSNYRQNRKYNAMKNAFEILYVHNGYMTSLTLDCFPLNRDDTVSLKI